MPVEGKERICLRELTDKTIRILIQKQTVYGRGTECKTTYFMSIGSINM